jgi:hypothetical protein
MALYKRIAFLKNLFRKQCKGKVRNDICRRRCKFKVTPEQPSNACGKEILNLSPEANAGKL